MSLYHKCERVFEVAISFLISIVIGFALSFGLLFQVIKNGFGIFKVTPRVSPPILLEERWGSHQYITLKKQGIKLHYVEKGRRSNPMLLFVHGFPECWFSWRHQIEAFSSDYWVVALDMRGYGDSDKPSSVFDYDIHYVVEDIREFVEEIGHSNCTLIAHDWGGPIAWNIVAKYPDLFKRHISLNGPHPGCYKEVVKSSFGQFKRSWYVFFFQNPFLPELSFQMNDFGVFKKLFRGPQNLVEAFPDEVLEAYKYYAQKEGNLKYPINYYRCNFFRGPLPEDDIKVTVPTLIIWGTEDTSMCTDLPKAMTKVCIDVQLKFVEGAGHFVHEEEPNYVNELILDYLKLTDRG